MGSRLLVINAHGISADSESPSNFSAVEASRSLEVDVEEVQTGGVDGERSFDFDSGTVSTIYA